LIIVNTQEAESRLAELLAAVEERGERVRISRNGKPIAELVPVHKARDPLEPRPELSGIVMLEDPSLPLTGDEWPEEFR
jgi:prevent-host-death family protein